MAPPAAACCLHARGRFALPGGGHDRRKMGATQHHPAPPHPALPVGARFPGALRRAGRRGKQACKSRAGERAAPHPPPTTPARPPQRVLQQRRVGGQCRLATVEPQRRLQPEPLVHQDLGAGAEEGAPEGSRRVGERKEAAVGGPVEGAECCSRPGRRGPGGGQREQKKGEAAAWEGEGGSMNGKRRRGLGDGRNVIRLASGDMSRERPRA